MATLEAAMEVFYTSWRLAIHRIGTLARWQNHLSLAPSGHTGQVVGNRVVYWEGSIVDEIDSGRYCGVRGCG